MVVKNAETRAERAERIRRIHASDPLKLIAQADLLAQACHLAQFDNGGEPVINHVRHVAGQFTDLKRHLVGLLHDILEDSPLVNKAGLSSVFGYDVALAVVHITRNKGERYFDYIDRCKTNELARDVKIADLTHNLDRTRWPEMPESYAKRELKALQRLLNYKPRKNEFAGLGVSNAAIDEIPENLKVKNGEAATAMSHLSQRMKETLPTVWKKVDPNSYEFSVGEQVRFESGELSIIGDVNTVGGVCDCCGSFRYCGDIWVRRIFNPEDFSDGPL